MRWINALGLVPFTVILWAVLARVNGMTDRRAEARVRSRR